MNVAIETSALKSRHRVRGVGSYIRNLLTSLQTFEKDISLSTFISPEQNTTADIIHYPYLNLFSRIQNIRYNKNAIITIHDVIPLIFPHKFPAGIRGSINLFITQKLLKKAGRIITDSHNSKMDISRHLHVPVGTISVVYLAADREFRGLSRNASVMNHVEKKYNLPGWKPWIRKIQILLGIRESN